MIRNIISIFIIIISIVLILILFDRIIYKELFNVIKIRGNISNDTDTLVTNPVTDFISNIKNIFVGEYEQPINISIPSQSQINRHVELGTNETIFIKDGVKLSNDQFLGINELKLWLTLIYG